MSDSGTVELSRDCGEEGTRHMPCHGKEDRNTILNELTCIDDTDNNDNTLKTSSDLLVDIHQKSVELIKAISSDNKENNNIDDGSVTEAKFNNRNKLNLDDVMMGDQPMPSTDDTAEVKPLPKVDKKHKKKVAEGEEKYLKKITKKKLEKDESDEQMMGDQPVEFDPTVGIDAKLKEVTLPSTITSTILSETTEAILSSTTISSTTETRLRRQTDVASNELQSTQSSIFTSEPSVPKFTTTIASTSSNPLPVTEKLNIKTNASPKPHVTEEHAAPTIHHTKEIQEIHSASDHFIPPMLLVRTQFSLSNGHSEHMEVPRRHIDEHEVSTVSANDAIAKIKSPTTNLATSEVAMNADSTTVEVTTSTFVSTTEKPNLKVLDATTTTTTTERPIPPSPVTSTDILSSIKEDASITTVGSTTVIESERTTKLLSSPPATEQAVVLKKTTETSPVSITEHPRFRQPHAPKHSELNTKAASPPTTVLTIDTTYATQPVSTTASPIFSRTTENVVTEHSETTTVTVTTSSPLVEISPSSSASRNNCTSNYDDKTGEQSKKDHSIKHHSTGEHAPHSESTDSEDPCWTEENASVDLSNSDYQPYRPNRRRVLTKPETHSYIKKVLG